MARVAVEAGFEVAIATSGDPEMIAMITEVLIPGAQARWASDAVRDADIVVLAIPLHKFATFDSALVAGKLVIDAMNYWPEVNGYLDTFATSQLSSSEIVQRRLARSTIIKTLNHIGYHELAEDRRPAGSPDRRAVGVAGDDRGAVDVVADVIERIGYDPIRLDSLSAGRVLEPGGPVFGISLRKDEFELAVGATVG
jgi:predicted dinucleotide-binding enzyme